MNRNPSLTNRQPMRGQCAFVCGSMWAASTWVHGGKLHSVLAHDHDGEDPIAPAPGEWGVDS